MGITGVFVVLGYIGCLPEAAQRCSGMNIGQGRGICPGRHLLATVGGLQWVKALWDVRVNVCHDLHVETFYDGE